MKATLPLGIALILTLLGLGGSLLVTQVGGRYVLALPDGETVAALGVVPPKADGAPQTADGAKEPAKKRITARSRYIDIILGENLFDHDSIGKVAVSSDEDAAESDLKYTLLATMVASPAVFSTALLVPESDENGMADAYGLGDKLGDATIIAIAKWEIRIRRADGAEEVLKLSNDVDEKKPRTAAVAAADDEEGGDEGGIRKTGTNSWEVDRELVDKHIANLAGLASMGRAIPHRGADGQIDGYRLSGIRRGTPGQKLGLRNGDIIHGVNGSGLTSMSEAMNAFQELQSESNLKFELTRRGKKQTNSYTIR